MKTTLLRTYHGNVKRLQEDVMVELERTITKANFGESRFKVIGRRCGNGERRLKKVNLSD